MKFSKITRLLEEYYFSQEFMDLELVFYHNCQLRKMIELSKKHLCLFSVSVGIRAKSPQSCPPLWNPMDYSPRGSSVHGILQTTMLEWVAMPSSRESSWPRNGNSTSCLLHWQAGTLPLCHLGSPSVAILTLYSLEITNRIRYRSILLLNLYSMALY